MCQSYCMVQSPGRSASLIVQYGAESWTLNLKELPS